MTRFPAGRAGFQPRPGGEEERRAFFDLQRRFAGVMRWSGRWDPAGSPYSVGDVVNDEGWTMVCNAESGYCYDKPAPQPTGAEQWIYSNGNPTRQDTAKQILFGNRYTWTRSGYLNGYRVYTITGYEYSVYYVLDGVVNPVLDFTASATGWTEFALPPQIVLDGTTFDLFCVVQEPDPTPTTFTGNWGYNTPPNPAAPAPGEIIHANSLLGVMQINKTDNDGGDRSVEFATLTVGDVIELLGVRYAIQSIADQTTYINFGVAPAAQAFPDGVTSVTFETVTATPITHMEHVDYWLTSPFTAQGLLQIDDGPLVVNDNAYGVDLLIQEATASDEWEVITPGAGTSTAGAAEGALAMTAAQAFSPPGYPNTIEGRVTYLENFVQAILLYLRLEN